MTKILVVDDDDNNLFTLTGRLKREGWDDVATAIDGAEALRLLAQRPFDLVLLDVMMPVLDGIETLTRIKADPALRHIPVIMISAATDIDRVVACIERGAEDYLPKPFNKVLLRARVAACLERKTLYDRERENHARIERQNRRLGELLHAILPARAVEELETTGRVEPRRYEDVAVLFCDVAAFTAYCNAYPPETVVASLAHLVEAFEDLAAQNGLEKIKIVGDALIATGGLLAPHRDGVDAALTCALQLMEAAAAGPAGWELRCGLHVGPVIAGVVGRSKFTFDLWGDTMNVAARLSGFGPPGAVYLSAAAAAKIHSGREIEALGLRALRGKGDVAVFRCAGGLEVMQPPTKSMEPS